MAILSQGILGPALGKMGPVTGYQRNGRNILRTSKNTGVVKITPARLAQREKIKVCNEFTHAFTGTGFFNTTFPAYGHSGTGYNRVTSCLMNLALMGSYPNIQLSWPKVLVARGPLPGAEVAVALGWGEEKIEFTWADNSGDGTARGTDKVILVAYCPDICKAVFSLNAGFRYDAHAYLQVPVNGNSDWMTWISFLNKGGDVADSVFCGMVPTVSGPL